MYAELWLLINTTYFFYCGLQKPLPLYFHQTCVYLVTIYFNALESILSLMNYGCKNLAITNKDLHTVRQAVKKISFSVNTDVFSKKKCVSKSCQILLLRRTPNGECVKER